MYAELHLHTCYSFLDGASQAKELADRAAEFGYEALAITDHDGLHGAMAFAQACAAVDVRPITGVELTLSHGLYDADSGPVHLTLLAENSQGYANLCRLITEAHRMRQPERGRGGTAPSPSGRGRGARATDLLGRLPGASAALSQRERGSGFPALDPSFLDGHTDGLIALSGCRTGEVARLIDAERFEDALEAARRLSNLFGSFNTFIELQQNLVHGDTGRIVRLAELATYLDLKIVATGNVHYHLRERHRLHDALVAVKNRTTLEASHRLRRANSEFFLRSPAEVAELFAAYPEAIEQTACIAERCRDFNLADHRSLGYDFPDFIRKPDERAASADDVLAEYCRARLVERYPMEETHPDLLDQAREQLETELKLVARHRLAGFFLIYRDLQELAAEVAREVRGVGTARGSAGLPPGRGRGSSVSSIICYLIGLSHVDPVRNRLFFQRFLNEDLETVPDIDLDFAREIREQLILRVYERYGHDHAALVCSFATYHLRSAVRDLGKVLGLPATAIDKLARLSEGGPADSVRLELERLPEFQGQAEGPLWAHLVELAKQLDGFPRHVSQHVGGMIISSRPLIDLVPVQPASMPGRFICQWDKDSCDDARFIKIDFLALGMLSLIEECLELIWQQHGKKVDLSALTCDDPAIYDAICRGDTVGLFQIESRAQIQMLPRTQPRNLDDLAVQVAIVRPGPIVGGAVNPYVKRRELQRRDPTYRPRSDYPKLLDDLLRDTLGVVLYQDQVLEVAKEVGGFTPGQADQFRRAMSRRRSTEAMERFREQFVQGAVKRGVPEATAQMIFGKLRGFSEFGFPKSHAYAFAILAYQSAWLRHYYPAEYYTALFNNQPMGFYAPHVLVGDARRHDVQVLRVAINRSDVRCKPIPADRLPAARPLPDTERGAEPPSPRRGGGLGGGATPARAEQGGMILLGLTTVRSIGEDLAQTIVAEREANGPYRSLSDLLRRTGLPRPAAENLIATGALGDLGLSRRELLWQLGLLVPGARSQEPGARVQERSASPTPDSWLLTPSRWRQPALQLPTEQDMVSLPEMDEWERMVADYGLLGLSPSYHPLGLARQHLPGDVLSAARLRACRDGAHVRTAGLVVCRQRPGTAKGFVFLLLEDETGLVNVVVRPDLFEAERSVLRGEPYLCITGTVRLQSGSLNLLAEEVAPLTRIPGLVRPEVPSAAPAPDSRPVTGRPVSPRADSALDGRLLPSGGPRLPTPTSHDFH